MGWMIESSADPMAAGIAAARGGQDAAAAAAAGANPRNYHPSPADMTNLTLSKDMMNLAERLSEDAHDTQALQRIREINHQACNFLLCFGSMTSLTKYIAKPKCFEQN